jgi:hypothetical protein
MSTKKSRSKSKSPKRSSQRSEDFYNDDQIDEILENITLKRPRSGYTHFFMEEVEKFKSKNKNAKFDITKLGKEFAEKWKSLPDSKKEAYNEMFKEERAKYKGEIDMVRHYLFKDSNGIVRRPPTAYRIYLNEKLCEGFEKNLDPKDVKSKASKDWKMMDEEKRKEYTDKKAENDKWFKKVSQNRKVTALSMFVQNTVDVAKAKNKEIPTIKEIAPAWKKLSSAEKEKYKTYADFENRNREKLREVYELVNGVKPKKPAGAFRVFLQENARKKAFRTLKEGKELWEKLSEDEKDVYLKKAHRIKLAYKYKKMIYDKKIKKILPKRPANAFAQFLKDKKGEKIPKGEKAVVYWRDVFDHLKKEQKRKYEDKAAKDRERYQKKMGEFKNCVFDLPKRPLNAFSLYVKDRMPDLKNEKPDEPNTKLLKKIAKEWKSEDGVSQSKYEKKAEVDKMRFKKQLKDFENLGYYKKNYRAPKGSGSSRSTRSKSRRKSRSKSKSTRKMKEEEESEEDIEFEEEEDEDEEEEKPKKPKKRSTSSNSKKGSKKSKTQDSKRRSSRSSKKSGKSQKKK